MMHLPPTQRLCLWLFLWVTVGALAVIDAHRPHIVLVAVDDVGYKDTQVYSLESNIPTPNLKMLREDGVRLDNFYTQTVCSPTRSALMTGIYPFRFGMQHRTTQLPGTLSHVPLNVKMIPEYFSSSYSSHAIGKWHCGYASWNYTPTGRGFHSHFGYLQAQMDYYDKTFGSTIYKNGFDFWRNQSPLWNYVGNYSVFQYHDELVSILNQYKETHPSIEKEQDQPLFIYYAMQSIHVPLEILRVESRCNKIENPSRRIYCSMAVEMDDAIGLMMKELKSKRLWDNTVLLLLTDNGGMVRYAVDKETGLPKFPASAGCNLPFRGSKTTMFEGGVHSLALVSGGKNFFPSDSRGKSYKGLVHVVDFTQMILNLGMPTDNSIQTDGYNLWEDILKGKETIPATRRSVPINLVGGCVEYSAIRLGDYKLIIDPESNVNIADGYWPDDAGDPEPADTERATLFYLFNLAKDPSERTNLVATYEQLQEHKQTVVLLINELIRYASGGYIEPQTFHTPVLDPRSIPKLHNGTWKPFLHEPLSDSIYMLLHSRKERNQCIQGLKNLKITYHLEDDDEELRTNAFLDVEIQ